ncbi:MAG: cupin-like domain-containing protein [Asticcacaulis sp.]
MQDFKPVIVAENVNRALFENEINPLGVPVILKGLVADWECVRLGKDSSAALGSYLKKHDMGDPVQISVLNKEHDGKFFYNDDLTGFNFTRHEHKISRMIDWCLAGKPGQIRESLYIQSQDVDAALPELGEVFDMPLLDKTVRPRIWLANNVHTQTHFDMVDNIACHIAGDKNFTLFAPEQVSNLYPGPVEMTPAGVPVSMVDMDNPDFERFPRFRQALDSALQANLEPGDALYIPAMWWHHVRTTGPLNMLVTFLWSEARIDAAPPFIALLVAALGFKHLPPRQRRAWQSLVNHYVFEKNGDPMAHLPQSAHGVFNSNMSPDDMHAYQQAFKRSVMS